MRVLGLDMGSKRIGVAVSDELGVIAQALTTITRTDTEQDIKSIADLMCQYDVQEVVIGYPRHLDGRPSDEAAGYVSFGEMLTEETGIPVAFWDERLTTVAAERVLLEGDMRRRKRRKVIDKVAATLILESYLASRQGTREKGE
ncbi:MAG: Holliday junction resolvase RuvX [Syntrophaceticus sp.]|jgi:putative Holliday junction resolvase|nr:Holliday junction resolvase RuvX [Syntrophaceticus sp.]MDD4359868.1 Holliday junction resolvase RuvX [Syntrophaceticus sp.]MDD4782672.1 Holliday junction resolvase RuvX [Syntrophaceticus sp.]HBG23449.1 Holliday junction resolvase RuvX [Peptococcaceae bacterium]